MKHLLNTFLSIVLIINSSSSVFAHSGKTDSSGCHTNKKTGDYHCHSDSSDKSSKSVSKTKARTYARGQSEPDAECSYNAYNCSDFSSKTAKEEHETKIKSFLDQIRASIQTT